MNKLLSVCSGALGASLLLAGAYTAGGLFICIAILIIDNSK